MILYRREPLRLGGEERGHGPLCSSRNPSSYEASRLRVNNDKIIIIISYHYNYNYQAKLLGILSRFRGRPAVPAPDIVIIIIIIIM